MERLGGAPLDELLLSVLRLPSGFLVDARRVAEAGDMELIANQADIVGIATGIAVGVGCTVATGGAGVVGCAGSRGGRCSRQKASTCADAVMTGS